MSIGQMISFNMDHHSMLLFTKGHLVSGQTFQLLVSLSNLMPLNFTAERK